MSNKMIENTSISKVPGWRDSRPDDKQRCASAFCDRRNSRRQTREDSHRWSTCIRRPTRSWQSSSKRRAAFPGSHSTWWKSWASLLHLKYKQLLKTMIFSMTFPCQKLSEYKHWWARDGTYCQISLQNTWERLLNFSVKVFIALVTIFLKILRII